MRPHLREASRTLPISAQRLTVLLALSTGLSVLLGAGGGCTDPDSGTGGTTSSGGGTMGTGGTGGWACPTDQPPAKSSCPSAALECFYGEEICCGVSHPSWKCMCAPESGWDCGYTDACLYPQCPDGGSGGSAGGGAGGAPDGG